MSLTSADSTPEHLARHGERPSPGATPSVLMNEFEAYCEKLRAAFRVQAQAIKDADSRAESAILAVADKAGIPRPEPEALKIPCGVKIDLSPEKVVQIMRDCKVIASSDGEGGLVISFRAPGGGLAKVLSDGIPKPKDGDVAYVLYGDHVGARVKVLGHQADNKVIVRVTKGHKTTVETEDGEVVSEWKHNTMQLLNTDQVGPTADD